MEERESEEDVGNRKERKKGRLRKMLRKDSEEEQFEVVG